MHSSLNIWNGLGNVGRDISFYRGEGGRPFLTFSICIDNVDTYMGGADGKTPKKIHTRDWLPIMVKDEQAELNHKALQCGSKVCITGKLKVRANKVNPFLYIEATQIQWLENIRNPNTPASSVAEA